jgi:hypothetical protein
MSKILTMQKNPKHRCLREAGDQSFLAKPANHSPVGIEAISVERTSTRLLQ